MDQLVGHRDGSLMAMKSFDPDSLPWIPLGPGESFKPVCFFPQDRGRVLLLRLEPGVLVPRHRHEGEVHAVNLTGRRLLIETGQVVGPGEYVFEPAGNVDSWKAVGDEPVVVHITAFGAMEYLDDDGQVLRRDTPASLLRAYERYCAEHATPAPNTASGTWARLQQWAPVYARVALASAFLSAVASRFGLWTGESLATRFAQFIGYTAEVNAFMPAFTVPSLAVAATVAELSLGVGLLVGTRLRWVAAASALLLALFGTAMALSQGIKSPLDYSVFSASACALLLAVGPARRAQGRSAPRTSDSIRVPAEPI